MKSFFRFLARSRIRLGRALPGRRRLPPARPFFTTLHQLLDRHPTLSLGRLLDEAGEQAYGLTVLLLAMLTFIPGVANVLSLATLLVGLHMLWGRPHPWLPMRLQSYELHRGRLKDLLARIETHIAWLAKRRGSRRAPSPRLIGAWVAWTAFIAALPIPLPFANALPAVALLLFGMSMLEEWPFLGALATLLSLGATVYFALSFEIAWHAVRALFRGMMG